MSNLLYKNCLLESYLDSAIPTTCTECIAIGPDLQATDPVVMFEKSTDFFSCQGIPNVDQVVTAAREK